jgi:hypothetical protein
MRRRGQRAKVGRAWGKTVQFSDRYDGNCLSAFLPHDAEPGRWVMNGLGTTGPGALAAHRDVGASLALFVRMKNNLVHMTYVCDNPGYSGRYKQHRLRRSLFMYLWAQGLFVSV